MIPYQERGTFIMTVSSGFIFSSMHLYKTSAGPLCVKNNDNFLINELWDSLINRSELHEYLSQGSNKEKKISETEAHALIDKASAPIGNVQRCVLLRYTHPTSWCIPANCLRTIPKTFNF